ncbi:MAG: hypothetical protein H8D45_31025 [Bacteroidetes bacterium]|nr:hypothetical protein [Bacteroidota bacterium]
MTIKTEIITIPKGVPLPKYRGEEYNVAFVVSGKPFFRMKIDEEFLDEEKRK